VDEYGGVTGLVTMEDLLECIFGDIPSPSDITEKFEVEQLDNGQYVVYGSMQLVDFEQCFNATLEVQDVETVGGLVLNEFGELPSEGDTVVIKDFKFTVSRVGHNRIAELHIEQVSLHEKVPEEEQDSLESPEASDH